jgi:hypothetical protein
MCWVMRGVSGGSVMKYQTDNVHPMLNGESKNPLSAPLILATLSLSLSLSLSPHFVAH